MAKKRKPKQNSNDNRPPVKAVETNSHENEFNSYNSRVNYTLFPSMFGEINLLDMFSVEELSDMVANPMVNNKALRDLSLILYSANGVFTNTVDYMAAMPTLDRVIVTHGTSEGKKRKNKNLMEVTLRKIKDREFIRDALFKGMVEGIAFYYFETTKRPKSNKRFMTDYEVECITEINELGINASIISLPTDYTKIVGRRNMDYVIAFNLDYFTDANGETLENKLRKYPKEIRDAWNKKKKGANTNGNWVVLNPDNTIVHKVRSKAEEPYGRPLVLAAINDILYGDYFTKTKRNVLTEINNRLVIQTFPEGKEKGTSALTKSQQEQQHNAVKNAIQNKNNKGGTSFASVAAGTKIEAMKVADVDIFDDKYESNLNDKISLDMGIAASLLNGTGSGTYSAQENNLELVTSQVLVWVDQIAAELNKCICSNIIKDKKNFVECHYLPITHVNKSKMVEYAKELYLQGRGSLSLWASACGISPEVFYALLDQELADDVENKYPVHMTSFTLSKSDDKGGRPETDNPTNKTVQSRGNNGNAMPSPSDE